MPLTWMVSMLVVEARLELRLDPLPRSEEVLTRRLKNSDAAREAVSTSKLFRRLNNKEIGP